MKKTLSSLFLVLLTAAMLLVAAGPVAVMADSTSQAVAVDGEDADTDYASSYLASKYKSAAENLQKSNSPEAEMLFHQASKLYEKAGEFDEAGDCAKKAGEPSRAQQLYAKAIKKAFKKESLRDAAGIAMKAGWFKRASEILVFLAEQDKKEGDFLYAAEKIEEAIKASSKAGDSSKVTQLYPIASQLFEKAGYFVSAAEYAQKAGDAQRALHMFRIAINSSETSQLEAARIAVAAGWKDEATQLFKKYIILMEERGEYSWAAEVAMEAGLYNTAVKDYLRAGEFSKASEAAAKAGWNLRLSLALLLLIILGSAYAVYRCFFSRRDSKATARG